MDILEHIDASMARAHAILSEKQLVTEQELPSPTKAILSKDLNKVFAQPLALIGILADEEKMKRLNFDEQKDLVTCLAALMRPEYKAILHEQIAKMQPKASKSTNYGRVLKKRFGNLLDRVPTPQLEKVFAVIEKTGMLLDFHTIIHSDGAMTSNAFIKKFDAWQPQDQEPHAVADAPSADRNDESITASDSASNKTEAVEDTVFNHELYEYWLSLEQRAHNDTSPFDEAALRNWDTYKEQIHKKVRLYGAYVLRRALWDGNWPPFSDAIVAAAINLSTSENFNILENMKWCLAEDGMNLPIGTYDEKRDLLRALLLTGSHAFTDTLFDKANNLIHSYPENSKNPLPKAISRARDEYKLRLYNTLSSYSREELTELHELAEHYGLTTFLLSLRTHDFMPSPQITFMNLSPPNNLMNYKRKDHTGALITNTTNKTELDIAIEKRYREQVAFLSSTFFADRFVDQSIAKSGKRANADNYARKVSKLSAERIGRFSYDTNLPVDDHTYSALSSVIYNLDFDLHNFVRDIMPPAEKLAPDHASSLLKLYISTLNEDSIKHTMDDFSRAGTFLTHQDRSLLRMQYRGIASGMFDQYTAEHIQTIIEACERHGAIEELRAAMDHPNTLFTEGFKVKLDAALPAPAPAPAHEPELQNDDDGHFLTDDLNMAHQRILNDPHIFAKQEVFDQADIRRARIALGAYKLQEGIKPDDLNARGLITRETLRDNTPNEAFKIIWNRLSHSPESEELSKLELSLLIFDSLQRFRTVIRDEEGIMQTSALFSENAWTQGFNVNSHRRVIFDLAKKHDYLPELFFCLSASDSLIRRGGDAPARLVQYCQKHGYDLHRALRDYQFAQGPDNTADLEDMPAAAPEQENTLESLMTDPDIAAKQAFYDEMSLRDYSLVKSMHVENYQEDCDRLNSITRTIFSKRDKNRCIRDLWSSIDRANVCDEAKSGILTAILLGSTERQVEYNVEFLNFERDNEEREFWAQAVQVPSTRRLIFDICAKRDLLPELYFLLNTKDSSVHGSGFAQHLFDYCTKKGIDLKQVLKAHELPDLSTAPAQENTIEGAAEDNLAGSLDDILTDPEIGRKQHYFNTIDAKIYRDYLVEHSNNPHAVKKISDNAEKAAHASAFQTSIHNALKTAQSQSIDTQALKPALKILLLSMTARGSQDEQGFRNTKPDRIADPVSSTAGAWDRLFRTREQRAALYNLAHETEILGDLWYCMNADDTSAPDNAYEFLYQWCTENGIDLKVALLNCETPELSPQEPKIEAESMPKETPEPQEPKEPKIQSKIDSDLNDVTIIVDDSELPKMETFKGLPTELSGKIRSVDNIFKDGDGDQMLARLSPSAPRAPANSNEREPKYLGLRAWQQMKAIGITVDDVINVYEMDESKFIFDIRTQKGGRTQIYLQDYHELFFIKDDGFRGLADLPLHRTPSERNKAELEQDEAEGTIYLVDRRDVWTSKDRGDEPLQRTLDLYLNTPIAELEHQPKRKIAWGNMAGKYVPTLASIVIGQGFLPKSNDRSQIQFGPLSKTQDATPSKLHSSAYLTSAMPTHALEAAIDKMRTVSNDNPLPPLVVQRANEATGEITEFRNLATIWTRMVAACPALESFDGAEPIRATDIFRTVAGNVIEGRPLTDFSKAVGTLKGREAEHASLAIRYSGLRSLDEFLAGLGDRSRAAQSNVTDLIDFIEACGLGVHHDGEWLTATPGEARAMLKIFEENVEAYYQNSLAASPGGH